MEKQLAGTPFGTVITDREFKVGLVEYLQEYCQYSRTYILQRGDIGWYKRYTNITVVRAVSFVQMARNNPQIDITCLYKINKIILNKREERRRGRMLFNNEELCRKAYKQVSPEYYNELNRFSKYDLDVLAPYRYIDYKIQLKEGANSEDFGFSGLYKISLEELEAAWKYIIENLKKGFIETSNAPQAAPVLIAKKGDGGLQFCINYQKLNAILK